MASLPPPPNFLIIGVERNATRWLRHNLDQHPDIFAPPTDTAFFADADRMARLGHRWYRDRFSDWDGESFLGESSPSYLKWVNGPGVVSALINRHLPDVRLVAIVGDPVDRLRSALRHSIRWGLLPSDADPSELYGVGAHVKLVMEEIQIGMQGTSLQPYAECFEDRLQIVTLDDIRADPAAVYASVLTHIGADTGFVPDRLEEVLFSDAGVIDLDGPDLATRRLLYSWYRRDVETLEELTGRDFSAWDPGTDASTPTPEEIMGELLAAGSESE